MYRATTPIHSFRFTENPTGYTKILVTYAQGDNIVLEKTKSDMTFTSVTEEGETVWYGAYSLTQEETASFLPRVNVSIQVRCLNGATAMASAISVLKVDDVINDEVL